MKDGHPVNVKLQRIFDLMDELKISLYYDPYRGFIVEDMSEPVEMRHSYNLMDLEDGGDGRQSCAITLPPSMETKLVREATQAERENIDAKKQQAVVVICPPTIVNDISK